MVDTSTHTSGSTKKRRRCCPRSKTNNNEPSYLDVYVRLIQKVVLYGRMTGPSAAERLSVNQAEAEAGAYRGTQKRLSARPSVHPSIPSVRHRNKTADFTGAVSKKSSRVIASPFHLALLITISSFENMLITNNLSAAGFRRDEECL